MEDKKQDLGQPETIKCISSHNKTKWTISNRLLVRGVGTAEVQLGWGVNQAGYITGGCARVINPVQSNHLLSYLFRAMHLQQ